jgi:hypothetical protein
MIQEFGWPKVLGQQCKHAKKEKKNESNSESMNPKKRKMEVTVNRETRVTPALCPPNLSHHAPSTSKCPVPNKSFKKGSAIDTVLLSGPTHWT